MHPDDAAAAGLDARRLRARDARRYGACVLKVVVSDGQRRGSLFAPIHWSDETASSARVGELVDAGDRSVFRPAGSQGDAGRDRAGRVSLIAASRWRATPLALPAGDLVGARRGRERRRLCCWRPTTRPPSWRERAHGAVRRGAEIAEYVDEPRGIYRVAAFADGRLDGCLFVGPADAAPQWDAVKALFEAETLGERAAPRGAVRPIDRRPRRSRPGRLRLLRRRPQCHPRARSRAARRPASTRSAGAARRHQLRLLPAGTEEDRRHMRRRRANRLKRAPPRMERAGAAAGVLRARRQARGAGRGGSAAAAWKVELLSAAGARVEVFATDAVRRDAGGRGRSAARRDRHSRRDWTRTISPAPRSRSAPSRTMTARRFRRRRARRRRAGQRDRQAGVLRFRLRRHRQPLAAGDRHFDRRRRAGVRAGDPRQARGAAAARLCRAGREPRARWRDAVQGVAACRSPAGAGSGSFHRACRAPSRQRADAERLRRAASPRCRALGAAASTAR